MATRTTARGLVDVRPRPPGIGKTRLVAELAEAAARDGAWISYTSARDTDQPIASLEPGDPERLALLILDDLEQHADALDVIPGRRRLDGTRTLLVVAGDDSALSDDRRRQAEGIGDTVVRPTPLDLDDIRKVAGLYPGASADALPASLEATGGVPRRVHRQVSEWAYAEASRRLGAAASRAAAGRSGLRSVESELADNVIDLQSIRERVRRYERGERVAPGEATTTPFKGLVSFEPADADLFFGRERLVADLVARLAGAPLLGVVGPSGGGKSSVVRAGLIPAIRSGVLPGSDGWTVALCGQVSARSVDRAVRDARVPSPEHRSSSWSTNSRRSSRRATTSEREAFLSGLSTAATDSDRRATIVVAIRADLYGRCSTRRSRDSSPRTTCWSVR